MTDTKDEASVPTPPADQTTPETTAAAAPDVGVALDLVDMPDGRGCKFHFHFFPDGVFDPMRASHQCGRAIQQFLNESEGHYQEFLRKREADMIRNAVLKVCDPVDGPLETMRGPSE